LDVQRDMPVEHIVDRHHSRTHDRLQHSRLWMRGCAHPQRKCQLNHHARRSEAKPHWYSSPGS
jgi:hypothetical protein